MNVMMLAIIFAYIVLTLFCLEYWVSKKASRDSSYFFRRNNIKWYYLGLSNALVYVRCSVRLDALGILFLLWRKKLYGSVASGQFGNQIFVDEFLAGLDP